MAGQSNSPEQQFVYNAICSVLWRGRLPENHRASLVALFGERKRYPAEADVAAELRAALEPYEKTEIHVDKPVKGEVLLINSFHLCDESFYVAVRTLSELYDLEMNASP